uniref:Uncharacterized protein n=1 Tax=Arundo donax TaxID=35708 RepID=A0A0A9A456_ARUDO
MFGKDCYTVDDLDLLPRINWCKAVVDDLRDAAFSSKVDRVKKGLKSISGCGILLIIIYLDNLQCHHQGYTHSNPTCEVLRFQHNRPYQRCRQEEDKDGKTTYGKLHLRNSMNTCYFKTAPDVSKANAFGEPGSADLFPSIQAELGVLVAQIVSKPKKREAMEALAKFDAKAKCALSVIKREQLHLQDAQQEIIRTLRNILEMEVNVQSNAGHAEHQPTHTKPDRAATTDPHPNSYVAFIP